MSRGYLFSCVVFAATMIGVGYSVDHEQGAVISVMLAMAIILGWPIWLIMMWVEHLLK